MKLNERKLKIDGRKLTLHEGGRGEPLLLLHGGWAGAAAHWGPVWEALADRYRVLAPELPGIMEGEALPGVAATVTFLERMLDALGCGQVVCMGNSLGAALGWSLAARASKPVRRLVVVNGGPFGDPDPVSRLALRLPRGRRLLRFMLRFNSYSPRTVQRAFANPRLAPAQVLQTLYRPPSQLVDLMLNWLVQGDPGVPPPPVPTLVLWGREDHLIGVSPKTALSIAERLPRGQLAYVDDAGHLPQVERPERFLAAVTPFLAEGAPTLRNRVAVGLAPAELSAP